MSKQLKNQQSNVEHTYTIIKGIFSDCFEAFQTVVGWCFTYKSIGLVIIILLMLLFVLIFSSKSIFKWLTVTNILCWMSYYIAVRLSYYSYGTFGNRYNVFFIPIWVITLFLILYDIKNIAQKLLKKNNRISCFIFDRKKFFSGGLIAIALVYCITGWDSVKVNWSKEDIRGVVASWYDVDGYNIPTLVYYGALPGFTYYVEHNTEYKEFETRIKNSVVPMRKVYRDKTVDEYKEYFDELYSGEWPDKLYLAASHISENDDLQTIIQCFIKQGYINYDVYTSFGAKLVYMIRDDLI